MPPTASNVARVSDFRLWVAQMSNECVRACKSRIRGPRLPRVDCATQLRGHGLRYRCGQRPGAQLLLGQVFGALDICRVRHMLEVHPKGTEMGLAAFHFVPFRATQF